MINSKSKQTRKASAFRGVTVLITAALLVVGLLLTACPKPATGSFPINFNVDGENGTITAKLGTTVFTSGTAADEDSVITFTATANEGYKVGKWTVNGTTIQENTSATLTHIVSKATTVTVTFTNRYDKVEYGENGEGLRAWLAATKNKINYIELIGVTQDNLVSSSSYNASEVGNILKETYVRVSLKLPDEITEIPDYAFYNVENLAEIIFPSNLTKIGKGAFYGCKNLNVTTWPEGLTELAEEAFAHCKSLTSITLPASVTKIGESLFRNCDKLEFADLSALETVKELPYYIFSESKSLTHVNFPPNLEKIVGSPFYTCDSLKELILPASLIEIGYAFTSECTALEKVDISACKKLKKIGSGFLSGAKNLKSIDFSACTELEVLDGGAFRNCEKLESVDLSMCKKITEIGYGTFAGATLAIVKLPESITEIKDSAFGSTDDANWCKKVLYPASKPSIGGLITATEYGVAGKPVETY